MLKVLTTIEFDNWLDRLRDHKARSRIMSRILRLADGLFGDVKPVGGGVSELRIDAGPGYRIYFVQIGLLTIILLAGGDKHTQSRDIALAKKLAREWKDKANEPGA